MYYCKPPYPTSFAIFPTSPEELIEVGHLMKVMKSSGHDDINPTVVGPLLHLVAEPLADISSSSFNTGSGGDLTPSLGGTEEKFHFHVQILMTFFSHQTGFSDFDSLFSGSPYLYCVKCCI